MTDTKYGHMVKKIPAFKDYGPGYYRQGIEMNGEFLGYDLNIRYGTFYNAGKLEPYQAQVCDYDQMMIFMGTYTIDMGYLGAEVDFSLGEEKEIYRITTATAVSIPKGMPFGPISVERMEDRFILMTISMAPEVKATQVLQDKESIGYAGWRAAKYRKYIKHLAFTRNGPWHYGPLNPDTHCGAITDIKGEGFDYNMSYESMNKAPYRFTPFPDKTHVHPYTEFLVFIGADCDSMGELGAECELCMGEEMERHLITTPSIAVEPKGHPHVPLRVFRQDKPWIFLVLRPWGHGGDVYSGGTAST